MSRFRSLSDRDYALFLAVRGVLYYHRVKTAGFIYTVETCSASILFDVVSGVNSETMMLRWRERSKLHSV
jgi:hypothetical protein